MSYTELSIAESVTGCREYLQPDILLSHSPNEEDVVIAPWLGAEPPTPKPPRSFGFPHKPSFSNFARQPSTTSLISTRNGRPSESLSIAESTNTFASSVSTFSDTTIHSQPHTIHKSKSITMFSNFLKKSRSRNRLRADSERSSSDQSHVTPVPPLPDFHHSFLSIPGGPPSPTSTSPKRDKMRGKKKFSTNRPPPLPAKDVQEPEFRLDTNFDKMDGIVDLTALPNNQESNSPGSGFDSRQSSISHSDGSFPPSASSPATSMFSNPFLPISTSAKRHPHLAYDRKVSPTTLPITPTLPDGDPDGPSWIPPESWAVEKEGEDVGEPESTSSEESGTGGGNGRPTSMAPGVPKRKRRKYGTRSSKYPPGYKSYNIRIYRANNSYHVASIGLMVTVAELTPVLNQKLILGSERETHRLYLKERGRERVLAQTERPADIFRRRLEQAGYDVADGLDFLGAEDLSFLLKFVYKSQLLGPAEEELSFQNFEYIDLRGRGLQTVPVVLHQNADTIVSLNLSRNPMLEIPLDFIQSCTTLRELRLANLAMKKVPQSVRHSVTLHRLDLSCNRIVDLDDAGLDRIPELTSLTVHNNRMEKLPWYFPRLRTLKYLTISNNKFRSLPAVVCEMVNLVDLDISFNMISELPKEIGHLKALETLIIVGNKVTRFPDECRDLISLRVLDCRRNHITDLSLMCTLPKLETLRADHNTVHALDLSLGPCLTRLDASQNDITQLSLVPRANGRSPYALTSLDISHAKLSSLDDLAVAQLSSLQSLKLDNNSFRFIPESLGELSQLVHLSCSDNHLDALPSSIGRLQKLQTLDAHNNSLRELPASVWNCASLVMINVASNLLGEWHDPPAAQSIEAMKASQSHFPERKTSTGSMGGRALPPLAHSLERLYLGENGLTDESLHPFTILKELRILNLSFNDIQDLPPNFFKNLVKLEEIYLSGNKLSSIPTEDLHRLTHLSVLFLNGNRLQTLPQELGKVQSLAVLDVGSNVLKYNINNWEFDWNWNFNQNLKYLNLSGNKRLKIKLDTASHRMRSAVEQRNCKVLVDFAGLTQLRVLGLMDVTTTFVSNIPEENEDRRVRTSSSEVNKMAYGIADNLGKNDSLNTLDLVQPHFRDKQDEAIFAMFGRAQEFLGNNRLLKYLHDNFLSVFSSYLANLDPQRNEGVADALRRSFLKLNKKLYDELHSVSSSSRKMSQASISTAGFSTPDLRSGVSGIVLYFRDKTMYVANAGNTLAVISRQGSAVPVSRKHDPFDRSETARIRAAEGWVSPKGLVNDEIDISRSFGFYHLLPIVNARPDVCTWELSELDEFVIIGNHGLWDYVSYQNAVDIARGTDPTNAAQKLRDFAISYGAEGSTMIMVICVADLFSTSTSRSRQPTVDPLDIEPSYGSVTKRGGRKGEPTIGDRGLLRLPEEVPAPIGHVALVFTDIRNSTHLWEANAGMPTSMRLHGILLRRQLRFCGGYEVKTEGDAFMCSFPDAMSALWWCLTVQVQLLNVSWPLEILECEDGKEIFDAKGRLIARGLSVRMGIHSGTPLCEPDPITHRMDYFGSMVNRSARITSSAAGGQIMCSADIIREINARILETEPYTEYSDFQPARAIDAVRRMGVTVVPVGEVKLRGLEIPETLSLIYPTDLEGRVDLEQIETDPSASTSRVQFSVEQIRELGFLCLRLEALSSSRVFRPRTERKRSLQDTSVDKPPDGERPPSLYMYGDPSLLLPTMNDKTSDDELMTILDSLSMRIENALASICHKFLPKDGDSAAIMAAIRRGGLDERTLQQVLSALQCQCT